MKLRNIMSLLLTYILIVLTVFLLQRKLMYFPDRFTQGELENQIAAVNLKPWPSSGELHGFVCKEKLTSPKGTILVFHGNADSAVHRIYYLEALWVIVLLILYPVCRGFENLKASKPQWGWLNNL